MAEKLPRVIVRRPKPVIEEADLSLLNQTELAQLAQFNEIPGAHLGIPREQLIHALNHMKELGEDPFAKKRKKFSAFIRRYWDIVELQLPSTVCPNCESCPGDARIAMCYIPNQEKGLIR